jgi:hypothetical protein
MPTWIGVGSPCTHHGRYLQQLDPPRLTFARPPDYGGPRHPMPASVFRTGDPLDKYSVRVDL